MAAAGDGGSGDGLPPASASACAVCKHQRRRCAADCPLAPYFPHDRPGVFRSAHRLFGVSNILKTLRRAGADPVRRHEAMRCVVYESQAWDLHPSAGCVPIILALQRRIRQAEHELRRVHADIEAYQRRGQAGAAVVPPTVHLNNDDLGGAAATGHYSCSAAGEAMSPSSPSSQPPPAPLQLKWMAAGDGDAAARAPFMYDGGDKQQQMMATMINDAVTSYDDGNIAAVAQTLPWIIQPPQYGHPFFVNTTTTTMVSQFQYQQQPVVVSTQLPEFQDDTMTYFADIGMNRENDKMPREESSTDSKATKKAPKMKDNNNGFKQDVASSSTLPAAANKS